MVMVVIVGVVGLVFMLVVVCVGKKILLVNKEVLVIFGQLLMDVVQVYGVSLLFIDSEYNVIFQCLFVGYICLMMVYGVEKIFLMVLGGLFFYWDVNMLD